MFRHDGSALFSAVRWSHDEVSGVSKRGTHRAVSFLLPLSFGWSQGEQMTAYESLDELERACKIRGVSVRVDRK